MADQIFSSLEVYENISMMGGATKSFDAGGGEIVNFLVDKEASLPSVVEARLIYNTATKLLYYSNGTKWIPLPELTVSVLPTHASTHKNGGTDEILLNELGEPTGNVDMNMKNIINVADPRTSGGDYDAVNYKTLKVAIAGGRYKSEPVEAVQTTNVSTFPPTTLLTIDGITATAGKSYLFTNQTNQAQNGAWVAQAAGTTWTRRADFDELSEAVSAMFVVERGTAYKDTQWMCTVDSNAIGEWGTTLNLPFIQIPSLADFSAGKGIVKAGNKVSVDISTTGNEEESDSLKFTSGVLGVKLKSNGGLTATTGDGAANGGLSVVAGTGITVDSTGVKLSTGFASKASSGTVSAVAGNSNVYTHNLGATPQVVMFYSSNGSQVYFDLFAKSNTTITFISPIAVTNITVVCIAIA